MISKWDSRTYQGAAASEGDKISPPVSMSSTTRAKDQLDTVMERKTLSSLAA